MTNTDKQSKLPYDTERVLLLSICHFIHDIYSSFLAPLLPFLIEKFGLSLTQAGFLSTVMQIPALLNPYIGKLADRVSVRFFIILAPSLTAVPMSLLGVAPSYGVLLILLFLTGISVSLFHVPAPVLVYKFAGERTGRAMSYYMTGGELARTLGPLTIIGAISLFGFDGFYPVMIVGIIASVIMYFKFKEMPVTVKPQQKISIRKTCQEMKGVLLPLSAILFVRGFMHACLTAFLPLYIMQQNGNVWLAGIALSLFEAAGVIGILTVGGLSDRFGRKQLLFFCLVVAPCALLLFTVTSGWLQLTVLLITGFSLLSTTPVMLAMIQEYSKNGSSAANGIFMMVSFLARSAVVVLVGFVADRVGLEQTFVICGVIGLAGIPLVLRIESIKKEEELIEKPLDSLQDHSENFIIMAYTWDKRRAVDHPDGYGKKTGDCGDTVTIYLSLEDGIIREVNYELDGCLNTNACCNALAALVEGKTGEHSWEVTPNDIIDLLETLPIDHHHCAELTVGTFYLALADCNNGKGK